MCTPNLASFIVALAVAATAQNLNPTQDDDNSRQYKTMQENITEAISKLSNGMKMLNAVNNNTEWTRLFADAIGDQFIPPDFDAALQDSDDRTYAAFFFYFTDRMKHRYMQYDENFGMLSRLEYKPSELDALIDAGEVDERDNENALEELMLAKIQYAVEYAKLDIIVESLQEVIEC